MRKTLKKVVVSVMAAISLSAAMTTVCSNAAYGNGSISVDGKGTGTLSTSTTALYATTSRDMPSYNIWNCQEMCSRRIPKILDRQESGSMMSRLG